ncbi:MAG: hypothetical protein ABI914_03620 [Acidobacteriota bacterium]
MRRARWQAVAVLLIGAASAVRAREERISPAKESPAAVLAEADRHYAARDAGRTGARANPREISEAISLYERAGEGPEAHWKLARALYFLGSYTGLDENAQRAVFERARRAGEEAVRSVGARRGSADPRKLGPSSATDVFRKDPDAPAALFWTAVAWGQWSLASGKMEAARKGAARRIRDDCLTVIALDPAFEEGGGYRILGRVHDQAPKIPLLTGWVSRAEGLRLLRLAIEQAPRNFVNRHFLAEALARSGAFAEAIKIEEGLTSDKPGTEHVVEELSIQEAARKNLAAWRSRGGRLAPDGGRPAPVSPPDP